MTTTLGEREASRPPNPHGRSAAELRNGDRMTREEFHRLYEQTPEDFRAELIGGTVYLPGRVTIAHGRTSSIICYVSGLYHMRTPGTDALLHTTVLLGDDSEPEPDLTLRIAPEFGGQSRNTPDGEYVFGGPELVIEVAYTSHSLDLHGKRADYSRHGVQEYLVWVIEERRFRWFDAPQDRERPLPPDGIVRSATFPGLWFDGGAIVADDHKQLTATLEAGLASPEHAEFVAKLAAAKR